MAELIQIFAQEMSRMPLLMLSGLGLAVVFALLYITKRKTEYAVLGWVAAIYAVGPMLIASVSALI
jgi:nitrate/nitrite transporter NarK